MTRWTSLAGRALAASIVAPLIVAALTLAAFVGGGVGAAYGQAFTGLAPADPVPAAAELRPGLGVKYLIQKFDSLREIEDMATWSKPSEGAPLPMLDYNVGRGAVLSNHNEDLVGAFIDGFIKLEQMGTYFFAVQHNDGVRLTLGGQQLYEDGLVAPDRFSPNLEVMIDNPGWYAISLLYYEKRNTSTLELYWQPPGAEEFVFVPAEAFKHLPADPAN